MAPRLVLVLVADQLNAAHVGFGGLELGHTPHLDALAARGMRFDRAHATNPTCMPSRASLATGTWPSTHGSRTNGVPLDPHAVTIQGSLRHQGWNTAAVGKLHYQPMGWEFSADQYREIEDSRSRATDATIEDGRATMGAMTSWQWEDMAIHAARRLPLPDDYYGFADVDLVINHGDTCGGHYVHWLADHGVDVTELAGHANSTMPSQRWSEVWRTEVPAHLSSSAFVVEHAVRRIEAAAASADPTLLFVSFPDPHHPFCPPAEYAERFDPATLPVPETFHAEHQALPPHLAHMHARRGTPHVDPTFTWAATEAQHREAMAAQLGLIALLDDSIGAILGAVDSAGLTDDTVIAFTADHGELGGEHGLWLKHYAHYPAVTRVPLVMVGQGIAAGSSADLVSNADLVPTLIDATASTGWRGIQGRSLAGQLAGGSDPGRTSVLIEEDQPVGLDGLPAPVRMRTLITDSARLTIYQGQDFGELYDHRDDPDELENRYETDPELRSQMTAALLDEMLVISDERRRIEKGA